MKGGACEKITGSFFLSVRQDHYYKTERSYRIRILNALRRNDHYVRDQYLMGYLESGRSRESIANVDGGVRSQCFHRVTLGGANSVEDSRAQAVTGVRNQVFMVNPRIGAVMDGLFADKDDGGVRNQQFAICSYAGYARGYESFHGASVNSDLGVRNQRFSVISFNARLIDTWSTGDAGSPNGFGVRTQGFSEVYKWGDGNYFPSGNNTGVLSSQKLHTL